MQELASLRGWLRHKTGIFLFNKRRYAVLVDGFLSLYQDEKMTEKLESYDVKDIVNVNMLCSSRESGFQISFAKAAPMNFQCSSQEDCERWVCALETRHHTEKVTRDDFVFEKLIGIGYSGHVFLARKKSTDELFAIKAISKETMKERSAEYQIIAERNILMLANHQFITRLIYAFQNPYKYYFAMEYVAGGDMGHLLKKEPLISPQQIKLYLAEIIVALRSLHKLGVIYRDLKPENILIDTEGHIKLADFGLARMMTTENSKNTLCGTCEYLAPEMIKGENQTFAVDYWSLGVIAYLLIVGTLPFKCCNLRMLYEMICKNQPRLNRSLKPEESSLIKSLLEKDPKLRLGSLGTDITKHPYFKDLDWAKVAKKQYTPEYKPFISRADSVSNFDERYTKQNPKDFEDLPGENSSSQNKKKEPSLYSIKQINDEYSDDDDERRCCADEDPERCFQLKNFSLNNEGSPLMNSIRSFEDFNDNNP